MAGSRLSLYDTRISSCGCYFNPEFPNFCLRPNSESGLAEAIALEADVHFDAAFLTLHVPCELPVYGLRHAINTPGGNGSLALVRGLKMRVDDQCDISAETLASRLAPNAFNALPSCETDQICGTQASCSLVPVISHAGSTLLDTPICNCESPNRNSSQVQTVPLMCK